jgi:hypothetical protein
MTRRHLASATGIIAALLWPYAKAEVVGYLALTRVASRWPAALRIGVPVLAFLVVVSLTYWLLVRALGRAAVPAIWSALITFSALTIYADWTVRARAAEVSLSALLVCAPFILGVFALRAAKRLPEGS